MKYRVVLSSKAHIEAADAAIWWAENRSAEQAARWYEQLHRTLDSLSNKPERHAYARENDRVPITIRQLLFGIGRKPTHRIVFHIAAEVVTVLSIRHVAQRDLTSDDL